MSTLPTEDVYKSENGSTATLFVKRTSNTSDDYYCSNSTYEGRHYINLYLPNSEFMINSIPSMSLKKRNQSSIKIKINGRTDQGKYVTRYDRLDLGVPVEVGHVAVTISSGHVFLPVVPGGLYRVKVWIISGQHISSAPNEATYRAKSSGMYCSIVN